MEMPQVRPGKVDAAKTIPRVIAYFANPAQANAAIQLVVQLGVPSDRLGVTPPERMPEGRGMILSIPCPDEKVSERVEALCRSQGAAIHHQRN
jgi:hypothetical protein